MNTLKVQEHKTRRNWDPFLHFYLVVLRLSCAPDDGSDTCGKPHTRGYEQIEKLD